MNHNFSLDRYQRQLQLKNFGTTGQQKLQDAKVLMIGAGGLGCSTLASLTAAGIGTIGIVDDDIVSLSNLHRQMLYQTNDVGALKAECARKHLLAMNPDISIISYPQKLTNANAFELMADYDIIIDGTDNFATKYIINDACVLLHKVLIFGAISQYEGQLSIFHCAVNEQNLKVHYRDLFPVPVAQDSVLNCSIAGVLGVLPGIIGTMQANECIKWITGIGKPLINQLLTYNALDNSIFKIALQSRIEGHPNMPKDRKSFEAMDYDFFCNGNTALTDIDLETFHHMLTREDVLVIDVRELHEIPIIKGFKHQQIPMQSLLKNVSLMEADTLILFCQSGQRSREAARQLKSVFLDTKKIFSLGGGILPWKEKLGIE
jgi:adenylyltransferase/sulfurtransferase